MFETFDYFKKFNERSDKRFYFCRICSYSEDSLQFLSEYIKYVKKNGVYQKGKIQNPDNRQLSYFEEIVGLEFKPSNKFLNNALQKWLPRLTMLQRNNLVSAMLQVFNEILLDGKNENVLKNTYIKFMCWFYYKFERILIKLGTNDVPKILYEGSITDYEFKILKVLMYSGCDILIVDFTGDTAYLKVDKDAKYSTLLKFSQTQMPKNFLLSNLDITFEQTKKINEIITKYEEKENLVKTNTFIEKDILKDILKENIERGNNPNYFYNIFALLKGVDDTSTYANKLYYFKLKLDGHKKSVNIIENHFKMPTFEDINKIPRKRYISFKEMFLDLSSYIKYNENKKIEDMVKCVLYDLLDKKSDNINKTFNKLVYQICIINNYFPVIFKNYNKDNLPILIYFGSCKNDNEVFFIKILSRLPIDVLIIDTNLNNENKIKDENLHQIVFDNSLDLKSFPTKVESFNMTTTAYKAEQELNNIIYTDGIYKDNQFKKSITITLQTTFEEIEILWNEEAKYRPNFEVLDDKVMLPVIYAKISGIKDNNITNYWKMVASFTKSDNTYIIDHFPFIKSSPADTAKFFKNGKLQIQMVKESSIYKFSFIRQDMQDFIFDKMNYLIENELIKGVKTKGVEFTIVSTILNLDLQIIRMLQQFDFTKQIPKLVIIHTSEYICSLEDSIMIAFLNLIGFDIIMFVPTGYQTIERYYNKNIFTEHLIGNFVYDLNIPNLKSISKKKESFVNTLFTRNNGKRK